MIAIVNLVIIGFSACVVSETQQNVLKFSASSFCNVAFTDCGSTAGEIINVSCNGSCTSEGQAIIKKGTDVVINFQFQAYHNEAFMMSDAHGRLGFLPFIQIPLDNPDPCKDSGLVCPISANTTLSYKPKMVIWKSYISVNMVVKWELKNKDGVDIFCVMVPTTITD